MKKLLIGLFACLCFTSCTITNIKEGVTTNEKADTLIVTGSTNYKISAHCPSGWRGIIGYRVKIGTFEVGDTVIIVKK